MKILLVNPPRSPHNAIYERASPEARRFVHRRLVGPPLGLLTVAAAVKDHEVTVLDMKGEYDLVPNSPPPDELARQWLARIQPRVVGVTFVASETPLGMEIFRAVKSFDPAILTVAGGAHATLCPQDFNDPAVDIVCPGHSALTFRRIVEVIASGGPFDHAPALRSYATSAGGEEQGRLFEPEPQSRRPEGNRTSGARNLDSVGGILLRQREGLAPTSAPAPEWAPAGKDFLQPDRSHLARWLPTYVVGRTSGPGTYLFTSLGCPYRCSFCSIWPQYGGHYARRDIESVVSELKTLDDYIAVRFADANTLADPAFIEALFDRIAAEGIRKIFIMDIRVDTAARHPDLIARLARGGLKVAIVGFESFRQEELDRYNKGLQAELIEQAVRVLEENGVMVRGNYVIPPDYGEEDFAALAEYAAAHPTSLAGYTILTPMPGTPFWSEARDRIVDRDLGKYNLFNCVMKTRLPLEKFYERVSELWLIRKGTRTL